MPMTLLRLGLTGKTVPPKGFKMKSDMKVSSVIINIRIKVLNRIWMQIKKSYDKIIIRNSSSSLRVKKLVVDL